MAGQGAAYLGLSKAVPRERPFGEYRLLAKLEHSGLLEGFLARRDDRPKELRLLRRLHGHLERQPGYVAMFIEQGELAARVEHHAAVRVLERGVIGARHFVAYEWLHGQTVRRLLEATADRDGLPAPVALRIVDEVLAALHVAHESSGGAPLVHGDVSPDNVVVTYDGRVVLLGFGAIRPTDSRLKPELTAVAGGYAYAAPEQAKGADVDRRADVWSVGVLVWEMLVGRPLFGARSEAAVLRDLLHGEISALDEVSSAAKPLARVVAASLCRDRDLRPATAKAFLDRLAHAFHERATSQDLAALVRELFAERERSDRRLLAELTGRAAANAVAKEASLRAQSGMSTSTWLFVGLVLALVAGFAGLWARAVP